MRQRSGRGVFFIIDRNRPTVLPVVYFYPSIDHRASITTPSIFAEYIHTRDFTLAHTAAAQLSTRRRRDNGSVDSVINNDTSVVESFPPSMNIYAKHTHTHAHAYILLNAGRVHLLATFALLLARRNAPESRIIRG